ncbi:MAG: hypothetical protein ABSD47_20860 [Candidatus Methylomirabilota bacterium]|jgi:hypothetical protein
MSDESNVGEALQAFSDLTKELRQFFLALLGPGAEETGQFLADKIRYLRFKNGLRTFQKAHELLRQVGAQPKPINLKLLVPIMDGCSLEEDDDLTSKWAGLLASAAAGEQIPPSYAKILSELSPGEARLLNLVDDWNETISAVASERQDKPRGHSYPDHVILDRTGLSGHCLLKRTGLTEQEIPRVMFDLDARHGLVHFYAQKWQPNLDELWQMRLTPFGDDFVRVCRGPQHPA